MSPYRALPEIPPAHLSEVWIDFDGTLTTRDVVDAVVRRFAMQRRLATDRGRLAGRTRSARGIVWPANSNWFASPIANSTTCSTRCRSIRGAAHFLSLARLNDVPVTVVSDGIDWFIDRVFAAHGLATPRVRSNTVVREGESLRLECPFARRPRVRSARRIASAARSNRLATARSRADLYRRRAERPLRRAQGGRAVCQARSGGAARRRECSSSSVLDAARRGDPVGRPWSKPATVAA